MHVLIPFASAQTGAATEILPGLELPRLAQLLALLTPAPPDVGDLLSLTPPHERAWAAAQGWSGPDGGLPFAARAATLDGIEVGTKAWGLVSPSHWHVGRDHVTLADPDALALDEAESRTVFDAVRELFESEGFAMVWGAPTRWYIAHDRLAELRCASLDRAIGRNVERWMRELRDPVVRRLQSELQLLLYPHPLNEAREANGALTLNSFWLSGCGCAQPETTAIRTEDALRAPLLADDGAAWLSAWQTLDTGTISELLQRAKDREPVTLTLCGERAAQRFESAPRGLWQRVSGRFSRVEPHTVLEAL